jgi:tetratricopeptide (TPR) repeat protein
VKRKILMALGLSVSALALSACGATMPMGVQASMDAPPPPQTSFAGAYLAANFAASAGDVKGAASFYASTLKDDPNNVDLLGRAFLFAAESGDVDQAIALTDRVLALDPDNRPAHLVREVSAIARKDWAGVSKANMGPSQGAFSAITDNVIEAWALAGARDFDGALAALDGLSQQRGVDGLRTLHRALILDYAGRDAEAQESYRVAALAMGSGPRVADAYGRFLLRHGRTDEALALYRRIGSENPGHPVVEAAFRDIAAKKIPQPLVGGPADGVAEALFGIAASLNDQRSVDVAILYLNLTLYLRPDFDLARVLLANRYEGLRKYDIANNIYGRIPPTSPYYAMTQVQAAVNDGRQDNPANGVQRLKALVQSRQADFDTWSALGDLQRSADQYADAVTSYDKAIDALPDADRRRAGLYYARGVSYERSGRWNEAERDFRDALKINPDRADVLNYLGYGLVDKGQKLDEAVAMLEKARALRPLDGFIADSVGWAYYKLGRYQDAVRALEEAVQLSPGASDINDHLGDAYWRAGRRIDARFQWNHALALSRDEKEKPEIERKLQFGLDAVSASEQ